MAKRLTIISIYLLLSLFMISLVIATDENIQDIYCDVNHSTYNQIETYFETLPFYNVLDEKSNYTSYSNKGINDNITFLHISRHNTYRFEKEGNSLKISGDFNMFNYYKDILNPLCIGDLSEIPHEYLYCIDGTIKQLSNGSWEIDCNNYSKLNQPYKKNKINLITALVVFIVIILLSIILYKKYKK